MYLAFFGLAEKPFAITPDPRYLYMGARHADALAHLIYGISDAGGFIQLTGEVGTGKTTTIRSLLARTPRNAEIALILNPIMTPLDFLQTLCEELGLGVPDSAEGSTKELIDQLNRFLLRMHAEGRRVVLIVDEAQNLAPAVLEQIRLLTNLETETQKLLQIILIGQPELRELLGRNDLRQLAQRITARYHLDPLSQEDTAAYVRHRLRVAGATSDIFTPGALREIYRASGGVPRLINILCDRALLAAYTTEHHQVGATLVRRASAEVLGHSLTPAWLPWAVGGLSAVLVAGALVAWWRLAPHATPNAPSIAAAGSSSGAANSPGGAVAPGAVTAAGTGAAGGSANPPGTAATGATAASGMPSGLADLLNRFRPDTVSDSTFTTLLGLWGAKYTLGADDGCTQAADQGLECVSLRGSFGQLRQLNRPAILMLSDESGATYQTVLQRLDDSEAELRFGTQVARVPIADLARFWFGDYLLLWRNANAPVRALMPGSRGPAVRHLREQLIRWQHGTTTESVVSKGSGSDLFDKDLAQMVEAFQRASRLSVDGVAGVETQLALDSALAMPGTPRLRGSSSVTH
ncbi:MAG: AAA family ATPase [Steroidobacteraceae bacterium]